MSNPYVFQFNPMVRRIRRLAPDALLYCLKNYNEFHSREHLDQDMSLGCQFPERAPSSDSFEDLVEDFILIEALGSS